MTVVLLVFVTRRFSPGVFLSVLGFTRLVAFRSCRCFPGSATTPASTSIWSRVIAMGKVVAALGMIVLALEDELNINKAAQRARAPRPVQLEAYTNLMLTRRRVEDFDRQGADICEIIVKHSRFAQAALLLEHSGRYRLAGCAGLDNAIAKALGELAAAHSVAGFLAPDSAPAAAEHSHDAPPRSEAMAAARRRS